MSSVIDPGTPNRVGLRFGQISELTVIVPLKPGGVESLRTKLRSVDNGSGRFTGADDVGTLHDMRFVILDASSQLLFATTYDGDWNSYISDFATKIPQAMDYFFSDVDGWPGIHSAAVYDFIAQHQIPADGWYVAYPDETVTSIKSAVKLRDALNLLFDAASADPKLRGALETVLGAASAGH
jgi:hypothetical protein